MFWFYGIYLILFMFCTYFFYTRIIYPLLKNKKKKRRKNR